MAPPGQMFEEYVQPIVDFVRVHQMWAAPIVFVLAFGESLAFISLLIPAWGALVLIGALIVQAGGIASGRSGSPARSAPRSATGCRTGSAASSSTRCSTSGRCRATPNSCREGDAFIGSGACSEYSSGASPARCAPRFRWSPASSKCRTGCSRFANFTSAFVWAATLLFLGDLIFNICKFLISPTSARAQSGAGIPAGAGMFFNARTIATGSGGDRPRKADIRGRQYSDQRRQSREDNHDRFHAPPRLLTGAAAAGAAATLAPLAPSRAAAPAAGKQAAGWYRYKVGDIEVTGGDRWCATRRCRTRFVTQRSERDWTTPRCRRPTCRKGKFALLVHADRGQYRRKAGDDRYRRRPGSLRAEQGRGGADAYQSRGRRHRPKSIDTVMISHFHGDHINGLLNADNTPAFPNAEIMVPEAEWAFWMDDAR